MPIEIPESDEQRLCQRLNLDYLVCLEHPDGSLLEGLTIDISLGGLKVACESIPERKWQGKKITLTLLEAKFSHAQFPCMVTRQENKLLALQLDSSNAAKFGLLINKDQFKRPAKGHEGV